MLGFEVLASQKMETDFNNCRIGYGYSVGFCLSVSFSLLQVSIAIPVVAIGLVAFLLSSWASTSATNWTFFFERKIQVISGGV